MWIIIASINEMRMAHVIYLFILESFFDFCCLEQLLFCLLKAKPVINGGGKSVNQ